LEYTVVNLALKAFKSIPFLHWKLYLSAGKWRRQWTPDVTLPFNQHSLNTLPYDKLGYWKYTGYEYYYDCIYILGLKGFSWKWCGIKYTSIHGGSTAVICWGSRRSISSLRIHVERAIGRMKTFLKIRSHIYIYTNIKFSQIYIYNYTYTPTSFLEVQCVKH